MQLYNFVILHYNFIDIVKYHDYAITIPSTVLRLGPPPGLVPLQRSFVLSPSRPGGLFEAVTLMVRDRVANPAVAEMVFRFKS